MVNYNIRTTNLDALPEWSFPDGKLLAEIGEDGFRDMMDKFYDIVVQSDIANFFPQDKESLDKVKAHNTKFFMEICGGKPLYSQENGDVDMIKAHKPFSITEKSRTEWLGCVRQILEATKASDEAKQSFWDYCEAFSSHLINSAPHQTKYQDMVNERW